MAVVKFTGKDMELFWGGVALDCLQSVTITSSVDIAVAQCAGSTTKEKFPGLIDWKMTINFLAKTTDVTLLNSFEPGITDDIVFYPAGNTTTYIQYSGDGLVASRDESAVVADMFAVTVNIESSGVLTIAATP